MCCVPGTCVDQVSESRLSDLKGEMSQLEEELEQTRYGLVGTVTVIDINSNLTASTGHYAGQANTDFCDGQVHSFSCRFSSEELKI